MYTFKLAMIVTLLALWGHATKTHAQDFERNDIPSCYEHANLEASTQDTIERELFIIMDKTVYLDDNMKMNVHRQLNNFGLPGDKVTIVTFTAVARGDYTKIPFTGQFELPPIKAERNAMNAVKLRKLNACLGNQKKALMGAHKKLKDSFALPEDNYPQTELVGALFDISSDLVAKSKANRKIVLVVSDMLENSKQLTFYKAGKVSVPSAKKALTKIQSLDAKGNFDQADIHVIGAGYLNGGKNYTNHNSMTQLERFWTETLSSANGNVKQFGKPNLLVGVN